MTAGNGKVTIATLAALKRRREKVVFLTAYDYPTATFADRAGADLLLVGDWLPPGVEPGGWGPAVERRSGFKRAQVLTDGEGR